MKTLVDSIIFKHEDYLIASKPAGILSQHSPDMPSIQRDLEKHFKRKLHILTRLDRPVSGLVMFSKESTFTSHFQEIQAAGQVTKTYIAVVEGAMKLNEPILESFHYHDKKSRKARLSPEARANFKPIRSKVRVKAILDNYSLVEIEILKGAFHQIRAQLAQYGHPVKGDVKYGARRSNRDRSIHLHARSIKFDWEVKEQLYESKIPTTDNLWKMIGSEHYA